ncbi:hypothetical protein BcepF1.052 [Burkholderia phage BcepF1]|uniref:Uncharacterized protein n=1 Tax=Burkholderia phage BcepF1 TaxID=2886897 RepID=A1YZV6_9CAUD|nr:hypothetical protein BcepF1.052 [Burkholderia phage BcepF1]ABL96783.1 hypothetical protein BcepF1.052 [Burkholderia phage BcepF1]
MYAIRNTNAITETAAIEAIFNACRSNDARAPKDNVTFRLLANGEYEATLRDADGVVIAQAIVDKFDC